MANNLSLDIIAKTQPARDELELLNSKIRDTRKEVRALAAEANKDPVAIPKFRAANAELTKLNQTATTLNKTIHATNATIHQSAEHLAFSSRSFRTLDNFVERLGHTFAGAKAGLAGFLAVFAGQKIGAGIAAVAKDLATLQQVASNTNLNPAQVKAYQDAMLRAGFSIDEANASLMTFGKVLTDARVKAGALGNNDFGVRVMKGTDAAASGMVRLAGATAQFIQVNRGGQAAKDLSDPLEQLGVDVKNVSGGYLGLRIAAAEALIAMQKVNAERAAGLGQQIFGPDWLKTSETLVANAAALKAAIGQVISPEDQKRLDDYNKAVGELTIAWNNFATSASLAFFPAISEALRIATDELNAFVRVLSSLPQIAAKLTSRDVLLSNPEAAIGGSPGAQFDPGGFASGGFVRGPGTSTSDSILARLSAGEFVLNAASVRRLGIGFLRGLNGFADGGLVGVPRFAGGGLATAGGTPVHLHLGAGSFALSGASNVVEALVVEAHRQQMRSAGTKPSWFAARPSGR